MGEFKFSDDFGDLCQESGARAGFQFEFHCERCNDRWRSEFVPYKAGQLAEWVGRASGFLGGPLGEAANAMDGLSEGAFGTQRDKQSQLAIQQAEAHFHRCPRCTSHVCDTCWDSEAGLCLQCASSAEVGAEAG